MPSPRKDSDATEHVMDEAKPPKVEIKSSGSDSTAKNGSDSTAKNGSDSTAKNGSDSTAKTDKLASSLTVLNEVIDVAMVKAEQVKSLEEIAPDITSTTFSQAKETISSQTEIPSTVDSNIDSSKSIATGEVSVAVVPTIKVTYISPDKIEEESEQTTGASQISEKVERKIEIEQNVEKLPQKPVCKEPEKTKVPEKAQLKSLKDTTVKEVKLPSEAETQKESELPKFDTNIDLSKTESVPKKTAPNVPVSESSTGKAKDESKEKIKSDTSEKDDKILVTKKDQESEIQAIEEVETQMSEVLRSEACLETDLDELKSVIGVPEPLLIGISDCEQVLMYQGEVKAGEYTQVTATKPVYSKASDDSPLPNIDLKGLSSDEAIKFSKRFDAFTNWPAFDSYLHRDRKEPCLKITKPDFTYVSTRLKQTVVVNQGKFQVSLDVSQFDIKNIRLSIKEGKIHVCAIQVNETEFGLEHHEIQQIFKIPNHVNRDEFTASITNDYRLLIEAPIQIPSSK